MVFHWSLSDSKSPQVSRTLLGILANLNNSVAWMISTPFISKSSSLCTNSLVAVTSTPITIGITFMLHGFLSYLARYRYLSPFSLSLSPKVRQVHFFLFLLSLGLVVWPRLDDPFASQNLREVCASHFLGGFWVLYYYYSLIRAFHISVSRWFFTRVSDSKSPQVSRTFLSILAVLNSAVVWMVSTRPPTSRSSNPFSNPLVTVPNAAITIGIIVTCIFP